MLIVFAWIFVGLHVLAMLAAMGGLLIAIPHPDTLVGHPRRCQHFIVGRSPTWAPSTSLRPRRQWSAGARPRSAGARRCSSSAIACCLSASAELTGTKTGWPFGGYSYTGFLGWKLGGARTVHRAAVVVLHGFRRLHAGLRLAAASAPAQRDRAFDRRWRVAADRVGSRTRIRRWPARR